MKTADLVDLHDEKVRFCDVPFRLYGRKRIFSGPISTIRCFEDNALIRTALESPGRGRVLVVDAGGSTRCAVVGDMLAEFGRASGWAGLVLYGCIRDSVEIQNMDFGVMAIGTSPKKSTKTRSGFVDVPLAFGDVEFVPGQYVYADDDGVLVSREKLV